jgi:hypothetical protein
MLSSFEWLMNNLSEPLAIYVAQLKINCSAESGLSFLTSIREVRKKKIIRYNPVNPVKKAKQYDQPLQ